MAKERVDKELLKGLAKAKELEQLPNPTREEIVAIYKDALEESEKLNKLLKPAWFMDDLDAPGRTKSSSASKAPKARSNPKKRTSVKKSRK